MNRQRGIFSLDQALKLGITRKQVEYAARVGSLVRTFPTVYGSPATPVEWEQRVLAAQLWLGQYAVLSHSTAARVWDLEGFSPSRLEMTLTRECRYRSTAEMFIHRRSTLRPELDVVSKGPLRVTTVVRTLIDLASVLSPARLELTMEDAFRRDLAQPKEIQDRLTLFKPRAPRGAAKLRELLSAQTQGPTESILEAKVWQLLRDSGLPLPARQYNVAVGDHMFRLDFAYPDRKLAIECDGYKYHSGRSRWDGDRTRNNALVSVGWRVIRVTWHDLRTPFELIALVRSLLPSAIGTKIDKYEG